MCCIVWTFTKHLGWSTFVVFHNELNGHIEHKRQHCLNHISHVDHCQSILILPTAQVSPFHSAIVCLWGLEFPVPGLLSVGCKMYCSRMCKVCLYYELSSYNRSKIAVVEWLTLGVALQYDSFSQDCHVYHLPTWW